MDLHWDEWFETNDIYKLFYCLFNSTDFIELWYIYITFTVEFAFYLYYLMKRVPAQNSTSYSFLQLHIQTHA